MNLIDIISTLSLLVLVYSAWMLRHHLGAMREATERADRLNRSTGTLNFLHAGREDRLALFDENRFATVDPALPGSLRQINPEILSNEKMEHDFKNAMSHWEQLAVGISSGAISLHLFDKSAGGRAIACWDISSRVIRRRKQQSGRIYDQFDRSIDLLIELGLSEYRLNRETERLAKQHFLAPAVHKHLERLRRNTRSRKTYSSYPEFSRELLGAGLYAHEMQIVPHARQPRFEIRQVSTTAADAERFIALFENTQASTKLMHARSVEARIASLRDHADGCHGGGHDVELPLVHAVYPPWPNIREWVVDRKWSRDLLRLRLMELIAVRAGSKPRKAEVLGYLRVSRFCKALDGPLWNHVSQQGVRDQLAKEVNCRKITEQMLEEHFCALTLMAVRGQVDGASSKGLGRLMFRQTIRQITECGLQGRKSCLLSVIDSPPPSDGINPSDFSDHGSLIGAIRTYRREGGVDLGVYEGVSGKTLRVFAFCGDDLKTAP